MPQSFWGNQESNPETLTFPEKEKADQRWQEPKEEDLWEIFPHKKKNKVTSEPLFHCRNDNGKVSESISVWGTESIEFLIDFVKSEVIAQNKDIRRPRKVNFHLAHNQLLKTIISVGSSANKIL